MKKQFGIIGAGNIGQTVARHLLKAGHTVILSNSKGPASLQQLVEELGEGAKAGTAQEAAQADIVVLSLPWSQLASLTSLTDWSKRIVIDATNHFITYAPDFQVADLGGKASSEVVAEHVPGAHVVKAFNTLYFKLLAADPREANGSRVIFISGDHEEAKAKVRAAIESLGFAVIDLGRLAAGGRLQEAKGPLSSLNLVKVS
jgi:predicted dinucleotide-binding enzyme